MKKITIGTIIILLFCSTVYCQTPKLYMYVVSHNEDNIGYNNGSAGLISYLNNRNALVDICLMLHAKNAKYNYGADYVALQAISNYDTGNVVLNTNNKNLVEWMKEDMGVECDPHSHENAYNYADIHYLMSQLNITPSNTISGYLFDQPQNGNYWDSYQNGIAGDSFPTHTWYPELLWGAGSPGHINDPSFFGVFKPNSMSDFFTHNDINNLIAVGTGCSLVLEDTTINYYTGIINEALSAIQNGTLPVSGIYTQEIFFSEGKVSKPWFLPLLSDLIDSVNVHVAEGTIEWKNISEIASYWKTSYDSVPFAYGCSFNNLLSLNDFIPDKNSELKLFPNPFLNGFNIITNKSKISEVSVYNIIGECVLKMNGNKKDNQYIGNLDLLEPGIYFVKIQTEKGIFSNKITKN